MEDNVKRSGLVVLIGENHYESITRQDLSIAVMQGTRGKPFYGPIFIEGLETTRIKKSQQLGVPTDFLERENQWGVFWQAIIEGKQFQSYLKSLEDKYTTTSSRKMEAVRTGMAALLSTLTAKGSRDGRNDPCNLVQDALRCLLVAIINLGEAPELVITKLNVMVCTYLDSLSEQYGAQVEQENGRLRVFLNKLMSIDPEEMAKPENQDLFTEQVVHTAEQMVTVGYERDRRMATRLLEEATKEGGRCVVGIVGSDHLRSISRYLPAESIVIDLPNMHRDRKANGQMSSPVILMGEDHSQLPSKKVIDGVVSLYSGKPNGDQVMLIEGSCTDIRGDRETYQRPHIELLEPQRPSGSIASKAVNHMLEECNKLQLHKGLFSTISTIFQSKDQTRALKELEALAKKLAWESFGNWEGMDQGLSHRMEEVAGLVHRTGLSRSLDQARLYVGSMVMRVAGVKLDQEFIVALVENAVASCKDSKSVNPGWGWEVLRQAVEKGTSINEEREQFMVDRIRGRDPGTKEPMFVKMGAQHIEKIHAELEKKGYTVQSIRVTQQEVVSSSVERVSMGIAENEKAKGEASLTDRAAVREIVAEEVSRGLHQ